MRVCVYQLYLKWPKCSTRSFQIHLELIQACTRGKADWLKFKQSIRKGEKSDLNDFERCLCQMGWFAFFRNCCSSRIFHKHLETKRWLWKVSSEQQSSGQECFADARDQRRVDRLRPADRRTTATQITTCMQNTDLESDTAAENCTACPTQYFHLA